MKRLLVLAVVFAVFIQSGNTLKCYAKCTKESDPAEVECPSPLPQFNTYSVCIYKMTYDTKLKEKSVYAGCGQLRNGQAPLGKHAMECKTNVKDPNHRNVEVVECQACDSDLCNAELLNRL